MINKNSTSNTTVNITALCSITNITDLEQKQIKKDRNITLFKEKRNK